MPSAMDAADGRWPQLLEALAGITPEQLTDRHQPCPLCGGTDRYRWDRDDGPGGWFCNQCGGKDQRGGGGTGMDLLMRSTGWSFKEACQRVEQHLGIEPRQVAPAKPRPQPPTQGAEKFWAYSETFLVCRFPGKRIRPLSWDGEQWRWAAPKAPRPLLYLSQLLARPDDPVIVAEGEKAADAAAFLFPTHVATTWPSGCKAIGKADWKPLAGRSVVLWPDADEVGIQAMDTLAQQLLELGAVVSVVTPPPDVEPGWDLADATWSIDEAAAYLEANCTRLKPLPAPEPPPAAEPGREPFTCLGYDADRCYYLPRATGHIIHITRAGHSSTQLVYLAPLAYWEAVYPSKAGVNWTHAVSDLFAKQAAAGMYDPDRVRGRGAWWDDGRHILHLGDRLITPTGQQAINAPFASANHYQRGAALSGPGNAPPLSDDEAMLVMTMAARFQWDVPASAYLLAGWVALAPICGALQWRPHVWLTAAAGSGKSTVLDRFIRVLLGDMRLLFVGNSSEAGIRQMIRSDALPVVLDEAESNEKSDQMRIQQILALARIASSESEASTVKGSPSGEVSRFKVRSMFLLCSISTALKQGADRRRFAQLTLRSLAGVPAEELEAHWQALDHDLDAFITPAFGARLLARSISLIPVIRRSVKVFSRVAARHFASQALGDQYGTLLAGAWSLQSSSAPTDEEAQALIDGADWSSYQQTVEVPDERRCLNKILQHQLRVETAERTLTRSIGELIDLVVAPAASPMEPITRNEAEDVLGRHGLRVADGQLLVSNTAEAIAAILRETAWASSWATILARLPGAGPVGNSVRFKGAGARARACAVPLSEL